MLILLSLKNNKYINCVNQQEMSDLNQILISPANWQLKLNTE